MPVIHQRVQTASRAGQLEAMRDIRHPLSLASDARTVRRRAGDSEITVETTTDVSGLEICTADCKPLNGYWIFARAAMALSKLRLLY